MQSSIMVHTSSFTILKLIKIRHIFFKFIIIDFYWLVYFLVIKMFNVYFIIINVPLEFYE